MKWDDDLIPEESVSDFPMLLMTTILAATLFLVVPYKTGTAGRGNGPAAKPGEAVAEFTRDKAEVVRLGGILARKERELDELKTQLDLVQKPRVGTVVGAPVATKSAKERAEFELTSNRVVHVNERNYDSEVRLRSSGDLVQVRTRRVPGETVAQIQQLTSEFMRVLKGMNRNKQEVSVILRPDSYQAFRKVRELTRQQNIDLAWEPFPDQGGKIYSSAGGVRSMVQK